MTAQTESPQTATAVDPNELAQELEQLSELATLVLSARDALSDDIVSRVAQALSEGITLLDRLTRNEGLMRLLQVLDTPESQHLLLGLSTALSKMSRDIAISPPSKGGLAGVVKLAMEPGTQEGLRSLSLLGKYWSDSMRELHRTGGK
ncbi:MAG: hypothetical protein B6D72_00260 [gamma proteobacterium symbiont of Ctena orbiculata]|uniref:DUF1641 domain-containing protein n=1 Tax=Candidatus Thiodiazotropha taylori TaxID=2792791 RepID=A0A944QT69_9GAMM|nr:hypothetical protein [Candidatus Thiodiazotropha taylori]PUB89374.1 MAG: hypothetical protein DBP00_02770 [gamma proteobacterium symbiont of Ctena orbiculata]MBT2987634.1 hypothetical protein [Candidatus Thiodiazotropha taylori]MBT2995111.1 hypothetical protein [Candidatus Thiodiazotropha taylori]MBT2999970.1 hypothetical protein [Candidatus Thiodiazotropha taylori]